MLADLEPRVMPGITHWNHPGFLAYFWITGSRPGILAEPLAATINANAMLWRTSPAATELEQLRSRWLAPADGRALELARPHRGLGLDRRSPPPACPRSAARGPRGRWSRQDQSHSSIDRACRVIGLEIGRGTVDDAFRMRADAIA